MLSYIFMIYQAGISLCKLSSTGWPGVPLQKRHGPKADVLPPSMNALWDFGLMDYWKLFDQARWVPEPPVDPATLDKTYGIKDALCRPNLMRMQSKDKPPSSIGLSDSTGWRSNYCLKPKLLLTNLFVPGKKKLMVENGRDQPLNGVSIYILRRWDY